MKRIIVLLLTLFLFSCNQQVENKNISEKDIEISKEEKIKNIEEDVIKEIEDSLEKSKNLKHYKTNKKITEKWKKEKIGKFSCDSGTFILNNPTKQIVDFKEKKEVVNLQKKVDIFNEREDIIGGFSYFISEFCKNEKGNKYIFWTQDKPIFGFGRYDKDLDIIEPAEFIYKTFNSIGGAKYIRGYNIKLEKFYKNYINKNNFNGFGKRVGNKILIKDFGKPIVDSSNFSENFLKKKNAKYCFNGLTTAGNKAICFADVYYSYDFIKNILTEDKICTYYINDNGKIKTLENCKKFNY